MVRTVLTIAVILMVFSCKNPEKGEVTKEITENKDSIYKAKGVLFAQSTQKVLGKNLMQAMEKGGPEYALAFCNTKAMPLTDSMAVHHNVKIGRVSDKPRNPNNNASAEQENFIDTFKGQLANGDKVEPILTEKEGKIHFYAPIITNSLCLKCHGDTKTDIDDTVIKSLANLYPEDEATGYTENQVRGAWHIVMEKE